MKKSTPPVIVITLLSPPVVGDPFCCSDGLQINASYITCNSKPILSATGERGEVTERKDVEESGSDEDMAIADKSKSPSP